jgi:hypothetical protein
LTTVQERRLRDLRSRVLVRAFDHRQRRHARGVWFRLRRVLAFAREAYALPRDEAERLMAEGHRPDPVGRELEPPRIVLFVPAERVARIASARPLAVRLTADLLSAECLALVPFPTGQSTA